MAPPTDRAFGLGAAIAFPGLAAAQVSPTDPTASLEDRAGDGGSLEGALGTDLNLDLGSLTFNLNLDAETPNPGSDSLADLSSGAEDGDDTAGETGTVTAGGNADAGLNFGSLG